MSTPRRIEPSAAIETHLLGQIDYHRCLTLQHRLADDIATRNDGQIAVLLCEHPTLITVGRAGSAADVSLESGLLRTRQVESHWVNRGGGCIVHTLGQLAVYPIVPLIWHGFSVGEYLDRLQAGLLNALGELGIRGMTRPGRHGIWGRTGQLVAVGAAVRNWVSYHGAFINVCPAMGLFRLIRTDPQENTRMSCLVAERGQAVRMTAVRAAVAGQLASALGCDRHHLHTGHPWLRKEGLGIRDWTRRERFPPIPHPFL
jgi:lipoyl(octanoyl) transferase